jgi:hypothetical protein
MSEPTVSELIERLRGIYTIPVNDGAGLLDGKDTFTRTFDVPPIQLEAADALARLAEENATLHEALMFVTRDEVDADDFQCAYCRRDYVLRGHDEYCRWVSARAIAYPHDEPRSGSET